MKLIDIEILKENIEQLKRENEIRDDEDYAQYELDVACGYAMALEDVLNLLNQL